MLSPCAHVLSMDLDVSSGFLNLYRRFCSLQGGWLADGPSEAEGRALVTMDIGVYRCHQLYRHETKLEHVELCLIHPKKQPGTRGIRP